MASDQVVTVRICVANLLLNFHSSDTYQKFDWESEVFDRLLDNPDLDLLNILKSTYN